MSTRTAWFVIAPGVSAEYEFDDFEFREASETQGRVTGKATGRVRVDLEHAERDW
ncbi:hypothetical protein GCM10010298_35450 [Streptomyces microflavus]|uniref:Uncharacterized protein n=1 Tax=Streptomyces microflavus TaxID=1919 RepID=A0A7J0D469_STRMI|nr:hypothetical protein Smic_80540 [Streptomyces microflavus]GGX67562.1 hypothetical protein GCM10010298_35450 [Streptomyces microflavus]